MQKNKALCAIFFCLLFGAQVSGYAEMCRIFPRNLATRATVSCPRLGHKFNGIIAAGPGGATNCGQFCDQAERCEIGQLNPRNLCLGKPSCSILPVQNDFSVCPGASSLQNYHLFLSCEFDQNLQISDCFGGASCFQTDFNNVLKPTSERFSVKAYSSATTSQYEFLATNSPSPPPSTCALYTSTSNTAIAPYLPAVRCLYSGKGGTSLGGKKCARQGMYLFFPRSQSWESFQINFSFYVTNTSPGNVGLVFRFRSPSDYYLWSLGSTCSGVYRFKDGTWTTIQTLDGGAASDAGTPAVSLANNAWYFASVRVETNPRKVVRETDITVTVDTLADSQFNPTVVHRLRENQGSDKSPLAGKVGLYASNADVVFQDALVRHLTPASCGGQSPLCEPSLHEDCINCPGDCPAPCGCGDFFCEGDAEVLGCPSDCGITAKTYFPQDRQDEWGNLVDSCPLRYVSRSPTGRRTLIYSKDTDTVPPVRTSVYMSFDVEQDPLVEQTGHQVHMRLRSNTLNPSSLWSQACGARGGGCFQTKDLSANEIVLRDESSMFGVLPIQACSFTVTLWAKVTKASNNQLILGWGDARPTRKFHRNELRADYTGKKVTGRWGRRLITATVNWADGQFHHLGFTYSNSRDTLELYVDGVAAPPAGKDCLQIGTQFSFVPIITYGEFSMGRFYGLLDEVKISIEPWTATQFSIDKGLPSGSYSTEPPTPPPREAQVGTPIPPTPFPEMTVAAPGPTPGTQAPTNVPAAPEVCTKILTCESCFVRQDLCKWCNGPDDQYCSPKDVDCPSGNPQPFTRVCNTDQPSQLLPNGLPCATTSAGAMLVTDRCGECGGVSDSCPPPTPTPPLINGGAVRTAGGWLIAGLCFFLARNL